MRVDVRRRSTRTQRVAETGLARRARTQPTKRYPTPFRYHSNYLQVTDLLRVLLEFTLNIHFTPRKSDIVLSELFVLTSVQHDRKLGSLSRSLTPIRIARFDINVTEVNVPRKLTGTGNRKVALFMQCEQISTVLSPCHFSGMCEMLRQFRL